VTAESQESVIRRIRTKADLNEGVAALVASCPHMSRVHALSGPPLLRRRSAGFKGLARVITAQQLSVASAAAIWDRIEARVRPFTPAAFLAMPNRDLRRAGLSRVKIATLRSVAQALNEGTVDLDALTHAPEEVIHAELTALKGIGPWTADIYILFCLARADAWAPGDLALQCASETRLGSMRAQISTRWSRLPKPGVPGEASPRACFGRTTGAAPVRISFGASRLRRPTLSPRSTPASVSLTTRRPFMP
jgi:DNA-3-methyladenine glycosylase II